MFAGSIENNTGGNSSMDGWYGAGFLGILLWTRDTPLLCNTMSFRRPCYLECSIENDPGRWYQDTGEG